MSDFFGISTALQGMLGVYRQTARRSGRSINLVNSLKYGDRVVCINSKHKKHYETLLKERHITGVDVIVIDPKKHEKLFIDRHETLFMNHGTSKGRTIFDHSWIEEFYLNGLQDMENRIKYLQTQSSGYGEEHIKTRKNIEEYQKWN